MEDMEDRILIAENLTCQLVYIIMVTDRIMEKKTVQLRQAAPASDFP